MATRNPATTRQYLMLLDQVYRIDPDFEQLQALLDNGDIFRRVLTATDLSTVDRCQLQALLTPPKTLDWTPVVQYEEKLTDWSGLFQLGLTGRQIDVLSESLPDHVGPFQPTSIGLTLGKGLHRDWEVAVQILGHELGIRGVNFTDSLDAASMSYVPGSEPANTGQPQLRAAPLDIGRFWDPHASITPLEVREQLKGQPLPALEVVWLLALSPQVYAELDGATVPYLWATGLDVGLNSRGVPNFSGAPGRASLYEFPSSCGGDGSPVVFR